MRHAKDPRRTRHRIEVILIGDQPTDANGDPVGSPEIEVLYSTRANIQPWLPRYNIPTAPYVGGVAERRIAARVYLPGDAPVDREGIKIRDVDEQVIYELVSDPLPMAGQRNQWRCDLGAARVSA